MRFYLSLVGILSILKSILSMEIVEDQEIRTKRDVIPNPLYPKQQQSSRYGINCFGSNQCIDSRGNKFNLYSRPICKLPNTCIDPNSLPQNVDKSLLQRPRLFYVTMGSCFGYSLAAEILLNRQVRTYQELYEMCPAMFLINSDDYYSGYGKEFAQTCTGNSNNAQRDCVFLRNGTDDDVDTRPLISDSPTLVDTDGKSWVLFYRCLNFRYGDFLLLTTRPYISKRTFNTILSKILSLGFSENEILLWPCSAPKYPYPFQDYLDICQRSYSS